VSIISILEHVSDCDFDIEKTVRRSEKCSNLITFINPFSTNKLNEASVDAEEFDELYIDGISLVHIYNFCKKKKVKRFSFDFGSIANEVFSFCETKNLSVALIGTSSECIIQFKNKLLSKYSSLNIVYVRDGYFPTSHWNDVECELNALNVDITIIGMGSPLQEQFGVFLKERMVRGTIFTCGGFFHQEAKSSQGDYYPSIVNKLNLRFLYRMYKEPKLTIRYFIFYPKFLIELSKEKLCYENKNKSKKF